jgi:hypothetical protein
LTRRANHRHTDNIARIKPAPETGRGLFESGDSRSLSSAHLRAAAIAEPGAHRDALEGTGMKKLLVGALIAGSFISFEARAQDRAGSAALGAVSGAVVLGPVGAVAGALIGYTAGPSIAHSWGIGRSASRPRSRHATQSSPGPREQAAAKVSPPPAVKAPETVASIKAAPPAARTPETVASTKAAPPVQGLD